MDRSEKYEAWAKKYEDTLPNLAAAFRSKSLQDTVGDIEKYDGWVRCTTGFPPDGENVLVTDGKAVWMGDYDSKSRSKDKWGVVFDGAPPFGSESIIAWQFLPTVLPELFNQ
jgi:hypothetical protein